MARAIHKLSVLEANAAKKPGRYGDGRGLYLHIGKTGAKSWVLVWKRNKIKREMGLGRFSDVSLKQARGKAEEHQKQIAAGLDPFAERDKADEPTFLDAVENYLKLKEPEWKNSIHRRQWRQTLTDYAKPLHKLKVSQISTVEVLAVLKPIWLIKHETALRLRSRIEAVLDYAEAMHWRTGKNPAVWRGGMKNLLPTIKKADRVKHHPALPVGEIPEFMGNLREREAMAATLLEFIILTASRSGEARGAQWLEFDLNKGIWTIPASRMKAGKEHAVPLSDRALEIVKSLAETPLCDLVFPNPNNRKIHSVNATRALLHRMERKNITTHGFRSTFRDWAGDQTNFQRETIEAALAHSIKDKAEAAYRRSSAIEKRRKLMQAWADYCNGKMLAEVVRLHG